AKGAVLRVLQAPSTITSVAFSSDRKRALSGGKDQIVRTWDLETGKENESARRTFRIAEEFVFSPEGNRFVTNMMQTIDLHDANTGTALLTLNAGSAHTHANAFSANGRRIIMGKTATFGEPFALVWDLESGKTFRFRKHTKDIRCVALSADGKLGLSAGND